MAERETVLMVELMMGLPHPTREIGFLTEEELLATLVDHALSKKLRDDPLRAAELIDRVIDLCRLLDVPGTPYPEDMGSPRGGASHVPPGEDRRS